MDRAGQHSNYAGQCKANAIELARFAEPQPVLAFLNAKLDKTKSPHVKKNV